MKKLPAILLSIILIIMTAVPSAAITEKVGAGAAISALYAGTSGISAQGNNTAAYDTSDGRADYIIDGTTGIRAEISSEKLDNNSYAFLRGYFNDSKLTEDQLFDRFFDLKKSYLRALENFYNVEYLSNTSNKSETTVHIFYEGSDSLFGIDNCAVFLYNISIYEGQKHSEDSHLDMIIPIRSTNTIELINFTIPAEKLGSAAAASIAGILSKIEITDALSQNEAPSILSDDTLTSAAKKGIYPAEYQDNPDYVGFEDSYAGFDVRIPDSYVPFVQNSLGGEFTYDSFKINPNLILSITSGPVGNNGIENAIQRFEVFSLASINITDKGSTYFGNNKFSYIYYTHPENGIKKYYYDYYIQNDKRLYKLQFTSAYAEPGENIVRQMKKILISFGFNSSIGTDTAKQSRNIVMKKYLNSEEGYSFDYPQSWSLKDVSENISYDRLRLVVPGMSGAMDVTVQESGIADSASFRDILNGVEGAAVSDWSDITTGYAPPFAGKTSILLFSDYIGNGSVPTIYRLVAFTDENGRNRLCYSIDILKGRKIYSMFITSAKYSTENGYFSDAEINSLLTRIAASFSLENTQESRERAIVGETRNRKLVLLDNYLKAKVDPGLKITSVGKIQPDNTVYVTVGNIEAEGYYKVWFDYSGKHVELIDRILKRDIIKGETDRLMSQYAGKQILSTSRDESKMLITVKYKDENFPLEMTNIYHVQVALDSDRLSWETRRIANRDEYIRDCELFIKSIISSDAKVYVYNSNAFNDLDSYRHNSLAYPVFTYEQDANNSEFVLLTMDSVTGTFKPEITFYRMNHVIDGIREKYGVKTISTGDFYKFDPETFTLTLSVSGGPDGKAGIRQFRVYYDMDNEDIDYEPLE